MSRIGSWLASDTDALQLDARLGAPGPETSGTPYLFSIRVIRVIRGEIISAFPHRVFGKQDRRAKGPRTGRA